MRKPPTGAILVATAAAAAAIATWALRPAPNVPERAEGSRSATSGSVALAPDVRHQQVKVRREVAPLEAVPTPQYIAETPAQRPVPGRDSRPDAASTDPEGLDAAARAALAAAHERELIAALRAIVNAQQQLQASAVIDTDRDGAGEYGYLGELMGASPLRKFVPGEGARIGSPGEVLTPPFLPADFGKFVIVGARGAVQRGAYYFQVHLPDAATEAPVGAVAEAAGGGADSVLPGAQAEQLWCCYAWPAQGSDVPLRAHFVNHEGTVLVCDGAQSGYVGANAPRFDAALSSAVSADMRQPLGLVSLGHRANDGLAWSVVGN